MAEVLWPALISAVDSLELVVGGEAAAGLAAPGRAGPRLAVTGR